MFLFNFNLNGNQNKFFTYTNIDCIHPLGSEEFIMKKILTNREEEVFSLLVENKSTREIGEILGISEKTVRNHISNAMQKLGVKGRAQAVVELIRLGSITI